VEKTDFWLTEDPRNVVLNVVVIFNIAFQTQAETQYNSTGSM
jgi:hypothetical protein